MAQGRGDGFDGVLHQSEVLLGNLLEIVHMLLLDGSANSAGWGDMTIKCGVVAFVRLDDPVFTRIGIHGLRVSGFVHVAVTASRACQGQEEE
jgi:hypothetical protein